MACSVSSDARNNRHFDLGGIDFEAEAESLSGPFKVRGALGEGDSRAPFHFSTGPIENGALNLKLVVNAGASRPGADLTGDLGCGRANSASRARQNSRAAAPAAGAPPAS